jgi:hypothetical protein
LLERLYHRFPAGRAADANVALGGAVAISVSNLLGNAVRGTGTR